MQLTLLTLLFLLPCVYPLCKRLIDRVLLSRYATKCIHSGVVRRAPKKINAVSNFHNMRVHEDYQRRRTERRKKEMKACSVPYSRKLSMFSNWMFHEVLEL